MQLAKIIKHWESTGCDEHCDLCLYGEAKDCTAEIKKDTKALIKEFKELKEERDNLVRIKLQLENDLEHMAEILKMKVEEVYPEFMSDYRSMEEELEGAYDEIEAMKKHLSFYSDPEPPRDIIDITGIDEFK